MKQNSILKHFATMGIGTICNMFLGVLVTVIITRLVDPDIYGKLSLFKLYGTIAGSIIILGLDQALIRYYYTKPDKEYRQSLLKLCVVLPCIITAICSLAILLLMKGSIIRFDFDFSGYMYLSIYTLSYIISRFGVLVLRLEYKTKQYAIFHILQNIVFIAFTVPLLSISKDNDFYVLMLGTVAGQLALMILSIASERSLWKFTDLSNSIYEVLPVRAIIKYALPFIISTGIGTIFSALDKLSIRYFCDFNELGIYSSALTLINVFAVLQTTFNSMWTPMAVEHYSKYPEDTTYYKKAFDIITVLMFMFGLTVILSKDIFAIILGPKYREAAYVLPFLSLHPIMYTISEVTVGGLIFKNRSTSQVAVSAIACLSNLAGNCILVPMLGGKGAAISTGVSYIVFFALRTILSNKYYYIDYSLGRVGIIVILSVAYFTVSTFIPFNWWNILAYCVCIAALYLLYADTIQYMIKYLIKFLKER